MYEKVPSTTMRGICFGEEYYGSFFRAWYSLFQVCARIPHIYVCIPHKVEEEECAIYEHRSRPGRDCNFYVTACSQYRLCRVPFLSSGAHG